LIIACFIISSDNPGSFVDLLTFSLGKMTTHRPGPLATQSTNPLVTEWIANPAATWLFYWGLLILMIAWIVNIRKSSFLWGMFQNIVQTVVIVGGSVVIVAGVLMWGAVKANQEEKAKQRR
ncbi:MAG: hypothetical protein VX225_08040, partial [Pseudomonadota bacterium]|nr:hypothetical protein [Pseudomonadota bacterium]